MRTASRVAAAVAIAMSTVAWQVAAQDPPSRWSIMCFVDTSSMNLARNEFDSAMRRSLRSLGDVEIGGSDSGCQLSLLKLTMTGDGPDTHFLSVLVTFRMNFRAWLTRPLVMQDYGIDDQQAERMSQSLDSGGYQIVKYFGLFSDTDPYELSRRIVSEVDTQVFEPGRRLHRELMKRIQDQIENSEDQGAR